MNNLRGILLMIAAMAAFTLSDAGIKLVSVELPVGEVLALFGLSGVVIFGIWALASGERLFGREIFMPVLVLRNACEMFGTFCITTSLFLIPLSSVSVIMQAAPLIATAGAALFLGQTVGWRRWAAIGLGFIGVLIVIRPGLSGFEPAALIALAGTTLQAIRDLSTRAIANRVSAVKIGFYGTFMLTTLGVLLMVFVTPPVMPSPGFLPYIAGMMLFGTLGYHMLNLAMRQGDVAVVIPFRYARILFGIAGGILIFSETPDGLTYLGAAIILGSGLYTFVRERRLRAAA